MIKDIMSGLIEEDIRKGTDRFGELESEELPYRMLAMVAVSSITGMTYVLNRNPDSGEVMFTVVTPGKAVAVSAYDPEGVIELLTR